MFFSWSSSKLKVKCLFWKLSPLWKQSYLAFDQFEFNNRDISCYRTEFRVWRQVTKQMKLTYLVRGWGGHGKENKERKKRDQTLSLIIACANGRGKRRDKISYFFLCSFVVNGIHDHLCICKPLSGHRWNKFYMSNPPHKIVSWCHASRPPVFSTLASL